MTEQGNDRPRRSVVLAQIETVAQMIRNLEEMEDATQLKSWSDDIGHQHLLALDDLRVLAAYLEIYLHTLERDG